MKTHIKKLFLLPALIAGLSLMPTGRVTAQTFTTLHSFTNSPDGTEPVAGLILSGSTLYGTASYGGTNGNGTVFAVNTNGSFSVLYTFTVFYQSYPFTNSDGYRPFTGLILSGNTLYGTALDGGDFNFGTVFAVKTDGTGFTNLYSFTGGNDGGAPQGGLILSGNTLYGTAEDGGTNGYGTVFAINTDGTDFKNLYSFTGGNDGANPYAGLILSGNILYGTANAGGTNGNGTVFAVSTNGSNFTTLHTFTSSIYNGFSGYTNSDGANPVAGLILSGSTLYGTANAGGANGNGTVFAVNTNGSSSVLHTFTATSGPDSTNSDGANPVAGLILSGNILYGTANAGGTNGNGTVFGVTTNGSYSVLHTFTAIYGRDSTNSDGANPYAGLILSGSTLYGTASGGGTNGEGTVFSLTLGSVSAPQPQLIIIPSGTNVILTWPTNATGFTLQSTTNLVSPAVWTTNSPAPVVVNGQNTVTNTISGAQMFYRLSQ